MFNRFIIAGSDSRCGYLAKSLAAKGFDTVFMDAELAAGSDLDSVDCETIADEPRIVVFPPNALTKDVCKVMQHLHTRSIIFAGKADMHALALAEEKRITYYNLLEDEGFAFANAGPTAEGALMLALENTPAAISGMPVLVLGGGKCAKAAADLFTRCRAQVTLVARSQADRDWASVHGIPSLSFAELTVLPFDVIINTVPVHVLSEAVLEKMPVGTLWIELASKPGGIDEYFAQEIGCRYLFAPGLPGRVAPLSAAKIMEQTILEILSQER